MKTIYENQNGYPQCPNDEGYQNPNNNPYWYQRKNGFNIKTFQVPVDYDLRWFDIWVLLTTAIILPFAYSFLVFIIRVSVPLSFYSVEYATLSQISTYVFRLLIPVIGMGYGLIKFFRKMIKYRILYFYFMSSGPIGFAISLIISAIVSAFGLSTVGELSADNIYYLIDIFYNILIIFLFVYKNQIFYQMVRKLKTQIGYFALTIVVGYVAYIALAYFFNLIQSSFGVVDSSNNQASLQAMTDTIFGSFLLFISAGLIAPITEEFAYRMIVHDLSKNKWYSIIISVLFFAFLHIWSTNDFEHFLSYLAIGIINGLLYYFFKNLNPCIGLHMFSNILSCIILLAGASATV